MIVLYTDGIIEAIDANHRWFGRDNLVRTIREHANQSPHVIAEEICRAAKQFAVGGLPPDDLTAMVLRFEQPAFGGEGI